MTKDPNKEPAKKALLEAMDYLASIDPRGLEVEFELYIDDLNDCIDLCSLAYRFIIKDSIFTIPLLSQLVQSLEYSTEDMMNEFCENEFYDFSAEDGKRLAILNKAIVTLKKYIEQSPPFGGYVPLNFE